MVVYVEYVLIDNFLIDYFLLKSTLFITGESVKKKRLILISLLGSVFSLVFPLIRVNEYILASVKFLFGAVMISLLKKWRSKKGFIKNFSLFLLLTFIAGGGVYALMNFFGEKNPSEFFIAVVFVPAIIVIKGTVYGIKLIYKRKNIISFIYDTEITVGKITLKGKGYLDTGNTVYDKDCPVIFCGKNTAKIFIESENLKKITEIEIFTLSGGCKRKGIITDSVKIYFDSKENIINNVRLCVVDKENFNGCEFLLHPALMNNKEEIKVGKVV